MYNKINVILDNYTIDHQFGYCSLDSIEAVRSYIRSKARQFVHEEVDWRDNEGSTIFFAWIDEDGQLESISWEVKF
jgi:hypothetical protein